MEREKTDYYHSIPGTAPRDDEVSLEWTPCSFGWFLVLPGSIGNLAIVPAPFPCTGGSLFRAKDVAIPDIIMDSWLLRGPRIRTANRKCRFHTGSAAVSSMITSSHRQPSICRHHSRSTILFWNVHNTNTTIVSRS
uniref:Uncharacterized protein n=1 Tax=Pyxicephalus adspersus TaxID=30357 RepID=A0AAV2ZIG5_PYXAD|nr:TPA: hypothetical protein GDO54_003144 [Pyxicephalus adspersus]